MKKTIFIILFLSQVLFLALLPVWIELTQYLHPIVLIVVWFFFSALILSIGCLILKEKIFVAKRYVNIVTVLYSIGLFILLYFRPQDQNYGTINLVPFKTIFLYLSGEISPLVSFYNLGANIGLFIPFGLYYCYINKRPTFSQLFLISICSIATIEGLQYITKRGSLDIDDLILNILGILIGYMIYPLFKKVVVMSTN